MSISIQELDKSIKNIFNDSNVQSVDTVYEKIDSGYRLVIDIKNLFYNKTNVIYTKLLFNVDNDKVYLTESDNGFEFKYLFDINCNYNVYYFDTINDLESKIKDIISNNKFGDNIKTLSEFIKSPSTLINNWFYKNNIKNLSIFNVKMDERYNIIPCKSLFFSFVINLNNQFDIKLTIKKLEKSNYRFDFKIYDETVTVEKSDLNNLIEIIGETIKTKYI